MQRTSLYFALTKTITKSDIDVAIAAFHARDYDAVLVGRTVIQFYYNHNNIGCNIRFSHPDISPWDKDSMIRDISAVLIDAFGLVENTIKNQDRPYDPNRDSTLQYNIWCSFDYAAALQRWSSYDVRMIDTTRERLFTCYKCKHQKSSYAFIWQKVFGFPHRNDLEITVARFEQGNAPCCDTCMMAATITTSPVPPTLFPPFVYIHNIYNNQFTVICPTCDIPNTHYINVDSPIPKLIFHKRCTACTGYTVIAAHNLTVHNSFQSYINAITSE
jgi:hypothetical protein